MAGKLLCGLVALVACASAASISGSAGIDSSQAYIGGHISFPQIPGINAPLFSWVGNLPGFGGDAGLGSSSSSGGNSHGTSDNNDNKSSLSGPLGPFTSLIRQNPLLNIFIPSGDNNNLFPTNLDDVLAKLPGSGGNRTGNYSLPSFGLPSSSEGPYIPGLSEALDGARKNLRIALNISADLSSGLRDAVAAALDSDNPADGVRVILNTIASVYSTVAANCPLLVVGARVFNEGVRLAGEVARSVVNVTVGPENNRV